MDINIDPKKELFKWGPIDGHLIYVDYFNVGFTLYQKRFDSWPDLFLYLTKEKMIAVVDYQNLRDSGEKNFRKYILNSVSFTKYKKEWGEAKENLLKLNKGITSKTLEKLNKEQLSKLYQEWHDIYLKFWTVGLLPELSNWGGEQMLKRELEEKIPAEDFNYVFEKLSAPENLSFYQKTELELFKLRKIVRNKKLFEKKIKNYQQKNFHILNSYHYTRVLSVDHFRKELMSHSPTAIDRKIEELIEMPKNTRSEKRKIIKKYNLNKNIVKIAERLADCIWWQDERKFHIFRANYYIDLFLKKIGKEYGINFKDLHFYGCREILKLANEGKRVKTSEINKRHKHLMAYYSQKTNSLKYLSGRKAKDLAAPYLRTKVDKNIKELKGMVVSSGKKVRARVKILSSPREVGKMKEGETLVAAMTSPDYIVAIRKASAIITDEGGMTCHAAIVSRELKIPCLVATKFATKVFKDGDLVEVDADKGVVKKLNLDK